MLTPLSSTPTHPVPGGVRDSLAGTAHPFGINAYGPIGSVGISKDVGFGSVG